MIERIVSRPRPVVKHFYLVAYAVTVVEAAKQFITQSRDFSTSAFARSSDAGTVWGILVILSVTLSAFLLMVYFLVEQYESAEGIFCEVRLKTNWRRQCELGLRLALFFLVSLKFINWSNNLDRAAQFLVPLLFIYLLWFSLVTSSISRPNDGVFNATKVVGVTALSVFLPLLGSAYIVYSNERQLVLMFIIAVLLAAVLLIIKSVLMAVLILRGFMAPPETASEPSKPSSG